MSAGWSAATTTTDLLLGAADRVLVESLTVGEFDLAEAAWHAILMVGKARRLVGASVVGAVV